MSHSDNLKQHLDRLGIPEDAATWLLGLWNLWQVFDDCADGDPVDRDELDQAIWFACISSHSNSFFAEHANILLPVVGVQIQKWQASDHAERAGAADARSYMWRAGFYDVVLLVAHMTTGMNAERAASVLGLYGETLEEYQKEFPNA